MSGLTILMGSSPGRKAEELLKLTQRAVSGTVEAGRPLFNAYWDLFESILPASVRKPACPCEIPEQECPPRCVCSMTWKAVPGQHLQGTIRLTNTGKAGRDFKLVAGTFQGKAGDTGVAPAFSPDVVGLDPGQAAVIQVSVDVGDTFKPGESYSTEAKVLGLYEQCVQLTVEVQAEQAPQCDVRQGEMPMRITEHHWYSHFQCEEPCFTPITYSKEQYESR